MNFLQFVLFSTVVWILMWFVYEDIPMNREIRKILTIVLTVTIAFWVANFFDVFNFLQGFHFGG